MDTFITPFQNAFIQGRNIFDNILLAHEIMDGLRKKRGKKYSFGALKIDMSKTYDKWKMDKVDNGVCHLSVVYFVNKWKHVQVLHTSSRFETRGPSIPIFVSFMCKYPIHLLNTS